MIKKMVKKRQTEPRNDDDSTPESCDENKSNSGNSLNKSNSLQLCNHIRKGVDIARLQRTIKEPLKKVCTECFKIPLEQNKFVDTEFEYDKTLWLCLKCGTHLCGRSKNKHALKHYEIPHSDCHALALNTTTYEVWCYYCDNEVPSTNPKISACIDYIKKHDPELLKPDNNDNDDEMANMKPLISAYQFNTLQPIPGTAKRINLVDELPSVRGLSNLGNTCFFNAVLQCLAQTPFLLEVLKETLEIKEAFVLPGGKLNIEETEIELPPIKGELATMASTSLTAALIETLEALQSINGYTSFHNRHVFSPDKLLNKFTFKCPQFKGYDQQDSHECLRHLLESVRCEDLNRYKRVILGELGYINKPPEDHTKEMKAKCKFYGGQAADRILRPEPVFRGFLVSTLQCQECFHTSSCHESFLDLSLPVSFEKPQPPIRHKSGLESTTVSTILAAGPSKHQIKKEKERERKVKRAAKHHSKRILTALDAIGPEGDSVLTNNLQKNYDNDDNISDDSPSSSSSEKSDADVEDNLIDDTVKVNRKISSSYDQNGNNELSSSINLEKRGDSPENPNKDSNDDENDSGIATSPANAAIIEVKDNGFPQITSNNSTIRGSNSVLELGISEIGANLIMRRSLSQGSRGIATDVPPSTELGKMSLEDSNEQTARREVRKKRVRTQSHSDWCTTIAPRYQCEDGECSIQSCLNNFTAVELMIGNNKVSCDQCTKLVNGENGKRVYSNATKQFLISSPPAVLILHLKRFQVGPRFMFKKLTKHVSFPMVLDIAPFCGSKVKNLPNVHRKQKELLYALYGVVEHSGGMYGGHYTAFVKVRPKLTSSDPRWKFLPKGNKAELDQIDEQLAKLQELKQKAEAKEKARQSRIIENDSDDISSETESSSSSDEIPDESEGAVGGNDEPLAPPTAPPGGEWYFVSDSKVQKADEETVLKTQAYLLFYERIY